jgi:hypothetical protein
MQPGQRTRASHAEFCCLAQGEGVKVERGAQRLRDPPLSESKLYGAGDIGRQYRIAPRPNQLPR